jgi:uncharacterized protein (DUF58 family)
MSLADTVQAEVLERLGRVGVAARQAVESMLSGQHRSLHRGLSVEFAGHRPYLPGDDLRHLDWQVWARSDRYDVRVYEEETRLRATLVVDASGSMAYGARGGKLAWARMLAAALGFIMVRQGDAVGLAVCDTTIRELLPPAATMGHLLTLLGRLEEHRAGGETSLAVVLDDLAERLQRRGLVVLISDCLDDPQRLLRAWQHLRFRKQDVRVFQVLDPDEETFPFAGTCAFRGLEQERELRLDADRVRRNYRQALASHRAELAAGCHATGTVFEACRSDEDLAMALVRALVRTRPPGGGR